MIIYDNIHGYIKLDQIASAIVDTPVFQRLRNIHQTGIMYLVFPTANHSRFEHSIGTYHLATQMISNIAKSQPELNVTDDIIQLVGIAGLCHDLGHLLFSHLFDDYFIDKLPNIKELEEKTSNTVHENRSKFLLNYLVNKYFINLNKDQLKVIGDLINPKESEYSKWKPKYHVGKWIFQIISNPINSIDVDKFDYILRDTQAVGLKFGFDYSRLLCDARVIDNKICYSTQCSEDIYHMFFIRYRLHRQIYNHKAVKAIEILLVKLLFEIEKDYKISDYLLDPEKMITLVDSYIWYVPNANPVINQIIQDINQRKLPKMVFQSISLQPIEFDIEKLKNKFGDDKFEIVKFKVGYVGGKSSNPLNNITFYNSKTGKIISENKVKSFSLLINQKHQEYFLRVYCTDLNIIKHVEEYIGEISNSKKEIKKELENDFLIEEKNSPNIELDIGETINFDINV
jgi:HD superfamily phosphohydrolase